MNAMQTVIREHARLIILRALDDQPDRRLNSALLAQVLEGFGIAKSRDWVHEELRWLEDIGAVVLTSAGSVRIAELTTKGADHVRRHFVIEGVQRPSAIEG